jgi:hypothetical protein
MSNVTKINLRNTVMTRNYDMNIWDETSYESGGEVTGGWKINFYQYPAPGAPYGNGPMIQELDFNLTEDEAKQLTLGWGPELGGDYCEDEDFWLDVETFKITYTSIPQRLLDYLDNLPEYEQSVEMWEPLSREAL